MLEVRWLDTSTLFVYLGLSRQQLLEQVASGEIKTKLQKNGSVEFGVAGAWKYDDCPLADMGGQCLCFSAHGRSRVSWLAQMDDAKLAQHPNNHLVPSEADVEAFEADVLRIVGPPQLAESASSGQ